MITFSEHPINRRDPDDEPSPEPFHIIYIDGSDGGELYVDLAAGKAEALVSQGCARAVPAIKGAARRHFPGLETVEVILV